jgi:hypothetical protein
MKKLILFISFLFAVKSYSQTIFFNNATSFNLNVLDFFEMECSTNTLNQCVSCYTIPTGISSIPGSGATWTFPKINIQSPVTLAVEALYIQDTSNCLYQSGSPSFANLLVQTTPSTVWVNISWTDLTGGDVQIDIW